MHESGEMYLETILVLRLRKGVVHSVDVAKALNFSKPSVSRAMKILRDNGFITMEQNGEINLTSDGLRRAEQIYGRHIILTQFLRDFIGVEDEMAEENACRMEHILNQEVVNKIVEFMASCPRGKNGTCVGAAACVDKG